MDLVEDSSPPDAADKAGQARMFPEGKVDEERLALDVLLRHESPVAAVLRIAAVVTHQEVMGPGHRHRALLHAHVALSAAAFLVRRNQVMDVPLVEPRAVDVDPLLAQLERVPWQADDALDEVALRLLGVLEHDDVAAANRIDR